MNRETRNNLIFLVILIIVVAPGGVMIFIKKSQPGERPIGSPDPVRITTAWIDVDAAGKMQKLAPLKTLQWLGSLAMDGVTGERISRPSVVSVVENLESPQGSGNVGSITPYGKVALGDADAQMMSEHLWFQALSRGSAPKPWVRVIVWDEDADPDKGVFSADTEVLRTQRLAMPVEIRHDIQETGFVAPPRFVTVVDLAAPASEVERGQVIRLKYAGAKNKSDTLTLP